MNWLLVFIGGGAGSVFRFGLSTIVYKLKWVSLPWATLFANVISCVVFTLAIFYFEEKEVFSSPVRPLLLTGFCGGLSTFSTFSFETFELLKRGDYVYASANILLNLILCLTIFAMFARNSN